MSLADSTVDLGGRPVGDGAPVYIVGEAGVNHNGDPALARRLADVARETGVSAVKFQSFVAEEVASAYAPKAAYQKEATGAGPSQLEMIRGLQLSRGEEEALIAYCREIGIPFLSTPFDAASADHLAACGVPAFKMGSGELTNLPLLRHVAEKGKPMILSTGMARLGEVEEALATVFEAGCEDVVLLHCVSNYPATPSAVNLRAIETMRRAFGMPVGFSDHTLGIEVALAAVALGACLIEKHFTLDPSMPGPDHRASLTPEALGDLVRGIRTVEVSLGDGRKVPAPEESDVMLVARRSLVASCRIPAGTVLEERHVAIKRPGSGLPPSALPHVLGRVAAQDIERDQLIDVGMLQ